MQSTLTEPSNGHRNVFADLEFAVRRGASLRPAGRKPGVHDFLASASGVIHVGAHTGQERDIYGDLPVIWIEALPLVYKVLCEEIAGKPNQKAYQYLIADGKRRRIGLSNNACQSSSIFDLKHHKELWPDVAYVAAAEMDSRTLAEIIDLHAIDLSIYDALVLDVQGAELLVLEGAGEYLQRFQWIIAEAADFDSYDGGCQLNDIDRHLSPWFRREHLVRGTSGAVGSYYEAVYRHKATCPVVEDALRLNLGAGRTKLPGFTNIDRKTGQEVYPLDYPSESVEEIVASHILEHFSHREVRAVLTDWVRALKPGGKIRLAVPDFEEVASLYLKGAPVNVQGYVMGGHNDGDDRHACIFDRESLTEEMMEVGLERIGPWDAPAAGCAAGPHSLNLQGFKPSGPEQRISGVRAVMSVPRFGPLMHPRCAEKAFHQLGIEASSTSSCYWAQQISNNMEDAIAKPDCDFVLTMDFDTVFCAADVMELYRLLKACPDVDAVIPIQAKRASESMLFSIPGKAPGTVRGAVTEADLGLNLLPANTGHFGLTLFRAESLRKFPRPWMLAQPNAEGLWRDGNVDSDISFWKRFREAGFKACIAPKVIVGHLEEVVSWPGKDMKKVYQTASDYDANGIPAEVAR